MLKETIDFALTHPQAHIAIVGREHRDALQHFRAAQYELRPYVQSDSMLALEIRLTNGTLIHFAAASLYERLRGWQFDRIEAISGVASVVRLMPDHFLETRLKPGITPDTGIAYYVKG